MRSTSGRTYQLVSEARFTMGLDAQDASQILALILKQLRAFGVTVAKAKATRTGWDVARGIIVTVALAVLPVLFAKVMRKLGFTKETSSQRGPVMATFKNQNFTVALSKKEAGEEIDEPERWEVTVYTHQPSRYEDEDM